MADQTHDWEGASGTSYQYWVYPLGTMFEEKPGNYIFAIPTPGGGWRAAYIGETENLGQRLPNHEEEHCAKRLGATHIHAHVTFGGEDIRRAEEKDLILKWDPPCNG